MARRNAISHTFRTSVCKMAVVRASSLLLVVCGAVSAQMLIDAEDLPRDRDLFAKPSKESKLDCTVRPVPPQLNLAFHFQTGFQVEVPMRQYSGTGHQWAVLARVTPQEGEREPSYLLSKLRIPRAPADAKAVGEFSGGYIVGEGAYRVDLLVTDSQNRSCVASWTMRARMRGDVKEVRPGMPAGAVDDLSMARWRKPQQPSDRRIAVLLHASALLPNRVRLRDYDRSLLLSALSSIRDQLNASVELTVFSLDRQKEIYRTENLNRTSFREAAQSLGELELGTVDYATLTNPGGHLVLLSGLLSRTARSKERLDAIVVLGPLAHSEAKVPPELLANVEPGIPIYNVQLRPWRVARAFGSDSITHAVKALGGRTKQVYSAEDFAEAIRDLEQLLSAPVAAQRR